MALLPEVPEAFQRFVVYAPREQFLGCWHAVPIQPEASGRLNTGVESFGPNTQMGLLVLSNYRLRHYVDPRRGDLLLPGPPVPEPDLLFPLGMIVRLELQKHPALPFQLLFFLRVLRTVLFSGGQGPSRSPRAWQDFYFVVEHTEEVRSLFEKTQAAAEVAGAELQSFLAGSVTSPLPEAEIPPAPPEGGPVHFHAEEDKED